MIGSRFTIVLILLLLFCSEASAQKVRKPSNPPPPVVVEPTKPLPPPKPEKVVPPEVALSVEEMRTLQAVIETSMGRIVFDFYADAAPNHVRQFVWLARVGYFDGMSVSRVIPKFIVQSGNFASWEETNPNRKKIFEIPKLKAEYDPNIKHERGAVSLARPNGEPDGGTCHFFICTQKASSLDGQYTVFGKVIEGLDILDIIAAVPIEEGTQDKPKERIEVRQVLIRERVTQ